MIKPPRIGTATTNPPRCASAGETGAVENRAKKNRLVATAIRTSRALASPAPMAPMAIASAATTATRRVVVKSPSASISRCRARLALLMIHRMPAAALLEEHRRRLIRIGQAADDRLEAGRQLAAPRNAQALDRANQPLLRSVGRAARPPPPSTRQ